MSLLAGTASPAAPQGPQENTTLMTSLNLCWKVVKDLGRQCGSYGFQIFVAWPIIVTKIQVISTHVAPFFSRLLHVPRLSGSALLNCWSVPINVKKKNLFFHFGVNWYLSTSAKTLNWTGNTLLRWNSTESWLINAQSEALRKNYGGEIWSRYWLQSLTYVGCTAVVRGRKSTEIM